MSVIYDDDGVDINAKLFYEDYDNFAQEEFNEIHSDDSDEEMEEKFDL